MRERKPIDAALRSFLDEQSVVAGNLNPAVMMDKERVEMVRLPESRAFIPGLPNMVETREVEIAPSLSVRLYLPPQAKPLPVLVYLHGGGWVAGSVETHDPFCRLLGEAAAMIIVSVEYRLAPEHPYPAALEDARSAVRWAATNAAEWGGDATKLLIGGDSAGANLAAVTANRLCAETEAHGLKALMLLYPVTDHPSANHPSYAENSTGYGLEAEAMRWFWNQYAPGISPDNSDISPLRLTNVPVLPPTLVATAEYDVLRDEGIAYAKKLQEAGVTVKHLPSPDMNHNFPVGLDMVVRFPQCKTTLNEIADWLRVTLTAISTYKISILAV
jgi:acetyl esterase